MNFRFLKTIACLILVMGCLHISSIASPVIALEEPSNIRIIYISNMPNVNGDNEMPSLAKVATFIEEERAKNPNLIFLHGGDSLAPSILSSLDRGAHIIDLLNSLNPDLMSISKREFSYGEDVLIIRSQEAVFPFVSNNLRELTTGDPYPYFDPSLMIDVNGVKVGIISSTSAAAVTRYSAKNTLFLDMMDSTKQTAAKLRAQGADIIISMYDDKKEGLEALIEDGHVDILFETSFYQENANIPFNPRFLHHDLRTGYISRLDIQFDPNSEEKVKVISFERVDISNTVEKPETKDLINSYIEPLSLLLDMELGHFDTSFNYSRDTVRTGEDAFANFIVDVMRDYTKTDIALLNGGAIRGAKTFTAGENITRRDIQSALPFRNTVTSIDVTGQEILNAIEHGVGCMEISSGCGTQLSNMRVVFDSSKPLGERIIEATIGGDPVILDKTYSLTTTNYIARGGDGFILFKDKLNKTDKPNNTLLWEMVSNYIFQHKNISPSVEGRLTNINSEKE